MSYRDAKRPRLFGHRGASGIAPENTLKSFALALEGGATHFELDVHMSRDGHVVVLHDPLVDRTTDGQGEARSMTLAELQALDAGAKGPGAARTRERIPTLLEVLDAFPDTPLNIEVKQADPPMIDAFFRDLDARGARDRVLVAAEVDTIMKSLRPIAGASPTGFSSHEVLGFVLEGSNPDYRPQGFALQVPETFEGMTIVTRDFVERAHRLGVEVHVWTVNDAPTAIRLLELGVDGIMSDVPGTLAAEVPAFARHR